MSAGTTVKTRAVTDRRELRFGRLEDLLRDVETLAAQGEVTSTGNWTPGQIVEHVTRLIDWSLDGFPVARVAWPLRLLGGVIKERALNRPMGPGLKVPAALRGAVPEPSVEFAAALEHLRTTVARVDGGTRMTIPSPLFGPLEHEQWEQLHCRHAEMHFSFMKSAS